MNWPRIRNNFPGTIGMFLGASVATAWEGVFIGFYFAGFMFVIEFWLYKRLDNDNKQA